MALGCLESWDGYGGDTAAMQRNWPSAPAVLDTTHAKIGTYSVGGSGASGAAISRNIAPFMGSKTTAGFMGWVYYTGTAPSQNGNAFGFTSGGSYTGFNALCGLGIDASSQVFVQRGFNGGVVLATSAPCLNSNAWNFIAGTITVNGGSGAWDIWVNEVQVLAGSGNTGTGFFGYLHCGLATTYWLDSVVIFDTTGTTVNAIPSNLLVVTPAMFPNADGVVSLTPSTGTDHFPNVDEAPANDDTDHNSGAAGTQDLYGFDLSSLSGRTLYAAQVSATVKATSAGSNFASLVCADAVPTETRGLAQAVDTSYGVISQPFDDGMFT